MLDEILIVFAGGLVVGFVGGYAGIGGAPILILVYGYVLGYTQHMAQGTVSAIMLGPMSAGSVVAMWGNVRKHISTIVIGVLTYAIFSYPGAVMAYGLSHETLRFVFACFLVLLGVRSFVMEAMNRVPSTNKSDIKRPYIRLTAFSMSLLGALVGMVGGFFGVGAGILMVPLLIWLFGVDKDDARAISLAILFPPVSVGAVIKYNSQNDVVWWAVLVGLLAYMSSNYFGARLGRKHSASHFNIVLGILLLLMGVAYGIDFLF